MISKEIEALIKNTLVQYKRDFNAIQEYEDTGVEIDFNITFTKHLMKEDSVPGYDPEDKKFAEVKALIGEDLFYMRISKNVTVEDKPEEKRVIYTGYRPLRDFKKKDEAKRSLLLECLKSLMLGGLEYSELVYLQQKEHEDEVEVGAEQSE